MSNVENYNENTFETIKHVDEYGNEYWSARDLQKVLEYKEWRNFFKVLNTAKISCLNSMCIVDDHFVEVNKMVDIGSKTNRKIQESIKQELQ